MRSVSSSPGRTVTIVSKGSKAGCRATTRCRPGSRVRAGSGVVPRGTPSTTSSAQGATTMEGRAAERVEEILAEHEPEPLPADIQRDLKKIVAREQEWSDSRA